MVVNRLLISAAVLASLSGCVAAIPAVVMEAEVRTKLANGGREAGPMAPAPLPQYAEGDQFFFSDGHSEIVVGLQNGVVQWQDDLGNRWTASVDFTLPATQRQTQAFSEVTSVNATPGEMWPLKSSSSASHSSRHEVTGSLTRRSDTVHANRRCSVDGTEKISVGAGQFMTYRIICDRYALGHWEQRTTTWYAPELGHPVKQRERFNRFSGSEVELEAYAPSLAAIAPMYREQADETWRKALETTPSGTAVSWKSPDGRDALTVTPLRTFRSRAQQYCRQVRLELTAGGLSRRGNAVACRAAGGSWAYTSPRVRVRMPGG